MLEKVLGLRERSKTPPQSKVHPQPARSAPRAPPQCGRAPGGTGAPSLAGTVLFCPALLEEVLGFVETPGELLGLCGTAAATLNAETGFAGHPKWEEMYQARWRAFHEALRYQGETNWREKFRLTQGGSQTCLLEVFHREKKHGFMLSVMPALCRWDGGGYLAKYLSASEVPPERIPASEEFRLRFCPAAVREQLEPARLDIRQLRGRGGPLPDAYPYRVLEDAGAEAEVPLRPGCAVELQWKMQPGSPFGWWFGVLEDCERLEGRTRARLTFRHFPVHSRWYSLTVEVGGTEPRACDIGGYNGGLRA